MLDIKKIDLNLLVVLDALLQEAHVTRAAQRIGLSQPATSSAMTRCRQLFDDPLLLRAGGGMRLTPKAQRLREELQPLLAGVRSVLEIDAHPLAEIQQTLRVSMSDSLILTLGRSLIQHLADVAPGVDLVFTAWFGPGRALDELADGEVDLAVSQFPQPGAPFETRVIGREAYTVAMRHDHPAAAQFNLDSWLAWPHILVSGRGEAYSSVDTRLRELGRERRVGVVVPTFGAVAALLPGTDLIATLPTSSLREHSQGLLAYFNPPVEIPDYALHIAWHKRLRDDPLVRHVRDFLATQHPTSP